MLSSSSTTNIRAQGLIKRYFHRKDAKHSEKNYFPFCRKGQKAKRDAFVTSYHSRENGNPEDVKLSENTGFLLSQE